MTNFAIMYLMALFIFGVPLKGSFLALLTGALADQAALFGVLTQIEALGLELVEVRRCESPGRVTPPHPGARNAEFS